MIILTTPPQIYSVLGGTVPIIVPIGHDHLVLETGLVNLGVIAGTQSTGA